MDECSPNIPPTPLTIVDDIKTLIHKNYNFLVVYGVLFAGLLCILAYICSDIYTIVKNYFKYKNSRDVKEKSGASNNPRHVKGDNESYPTYDEENPVFMDRKPKDYRPTKEKVFYENMDKKYKEYNTKKSEYIKQTYNRDIDDKVDDTVQYPKYDDYEYKKPDTLR
jgi:hypothetical protein